MTFSAVYDLRMAPVSSDFGAFMAIADCARQVACSESLSVTILKDGFRFLSERDIKTPAEEKIHRIHGILLPQLSLFPSLSSFTFTSDPVSRDYDFPENYPNGRCPYLIGNIHQYFEHGADPCCVEAPEYAVRMAPKTDVVLSLRVSKHFQDRNSNIQDWGKLHDNLSALGLNVLVIPDQDNIEACKEWNWELYEPAAWDIRYRYGLYANSRLNVCAAHGPASLLYFSPYPFVMFDHSRGNVITAEQYERHWGINQGTQMPWFKPNQRITWCDSNHTTLTRHAFEMLEISEAA